MSFVEDLSESLPGPYKILSGFRSPVKVTRSVTTRGDKEERQPGVTKTPFLHFPKKKDDSGGEPLSTAYKLFS
jgi:hypothetical protein